MSSEIWSRNNPLFMYGNEEKIDDLLSRISGDLTIQSEESEVRTNKIEGKGSVKFGEFLKFLNLPEIEASAGAEIRSDRTRKYISRMTFDSKLNALTMYVSGLDFFPYFDVYNGNYMFRNSKKLVPEWDGEQISANHRIDAIGQIVGFFSPVRMYPPHDESANIVEDYMKGINNLWLLKSTDDSSIRASIPIFIGKTRSASQHAILTFLKYGDRLKIESFGLLTWVDDGVTCDPVAWRLFY